MASCWSSRAYPVENHDKCIIYLESRKLYTQSHSTGERQYFNNLCGIPVQSLCGGRFSYSLRKSTNASKIWMIWWTHVSYHVISTRRHPELSSQTIKAAGWKILGLIAGVRDVPWFRTRKTAVYLWRLINCLHVLHLGGWGVGGWFSRKSRSTEI